MTDLAEEAPPDLTKREEQAFAFAADTTKQLLSLSLAILGVTITFRTELLSADSWRSLLAISWGSFLVSTVFGILVMMALTGEMEPGGDLSRRPSIRGTNVAIWARVQAGTFALGVMLITVFGVGALWTDPVQVPSQSVTSRPAGHLPAVR